MLGFKKTNFFPRRRKVKTIIKVEMKPEPPVVLNVPGIRFVGKDENLDYLDALLPPPGLPMRARKQKTKSPKNSSK